MFSGHTHGGQCRLPTGRALINSTDLPLRLTSGLLRHKNTICLVSRGLGEVHMPLRAFCPPQLPVYTLRVGPMHGQFTHRIENVLPW
jgi:predicted MPP superfamily phosphohydrolase